MTNENPEVDAFLAALGHPRGAAVQRLRRAVLGADPGITETVKWNAPNFRFDGLDRVTFRLRPGDRVQLVFHRGAKARDDVGAFAFDDPEGLLAWAAPDRGVLTIPADPEEGPTDAVVVDLVRRWLAA